MRKTSLHFALFSVLSNIVIPHDTQAQTNFWQPVGSPDSTVNSVLAVSNGLLLITAPAGVFRSTDDGNTWSLVITMPTTSLNRFVVHPNGNLYVTYLGTGSPRRSTDSGLTWHERRGNLPFGSFPSVLALDSTGTMFAAGHWTPDYVRTFPMIWKTTDEGTIWSASYSTASLGFATSLALTTNGQIFAGSSEIGHAIMRSSDGGNTWATDTSGFISNTIPTVLATSIGGQIFVGSGNGIYRSTDGGDSWHPVNSGLSDMRIRAISVNKRDHVFVGTRAEGVFVSNNNGGFWNAINSGMTDSQINCLFTNQNGYLFAATQRGGLFRSVAPTTAVDELGSECSTELSLGQNYPNPFNPNTNIKFQIPHSSFVTLKVYDLLGREVATLVNEEMEAGRYEKVFNAEGLASGVYLYRLQAKGLVQSKKFILLR